MNQDIPIDIGRDAARDAAGRELSDPAYQAAEPSWFTRAMRWLAEQLDDLLTGASGLLPGGLPSLIVLLLVILAIAVLVRLKVGKLARTTGAPVFSERVRTAADHRHAAETAAAQGDLAEAVRERFRAVVRALEEHGILDPRSGRTVDEVARDAGHRLPQHANALRSAATVFDDIWYGGHPATTDAYQQLVDLDTSLAGALR